MGNKKVFELTCGEFSFLLRKKDVKFYNGYGVVKAAIDKESNLIGVVDKNFKEVLPLTSEEFAPRLFIASNGNFIFAGYISELDCYKVFHVSHSGYEVNLGAFDFLPLDDEIMQLYYDEYSVLYDSQTGEFLTPFYHYIGPFIYSDKYGCKVARASFQVEDNNIIIDEVSTIINTRGVILENYFDLALGKELECKDATEVLKLVRKASNKSDC